MSSSQSHHDQQVQPARPSGRKTKPPTACRTCHLRKTRCELVGADGCQRCRVLELTCSLIGEGGSHKLSPSDSNAGSKHTAIVMTVDQELSRTRADMQVLLAQLRSATAELERVVSTSGRAGHRVPSGSVAMGARPDGEGDGDDLEPAVAARLTGSMGAAQLVMTGINLHDRNVYVDPIHAGAITAESMQEAVELFVERFPAYDPDFLEIPMDDAVVRAAIIQYTSFTRDGAAASAQHRIEGMLDEHLLAMQTSDASLAHMIALYIFSLAPASGHEARLHRAVDNRHSAHRAKEMACRLGLDDAVLQSCEETNQDLFTLPFLRPLLIRTCWWFAVCNRVACPSLSATPLHTPSLHQVFSADTLAGYKSPALRHLIDERRLLEIVEPVSMQLKRARNSRMVDRAHLQSMLETLQEAMRQFAAWRQHLADDSWLLGLQSHMLECLLILKITTDCATLLPSPLPIEMRHLTLGMASRIPSACADAVLYSVGNLIDLAQLPAFMLSLCFVPFKALHHSAMMTGDGFWTTLPEGSARAFNIFRGMLITSHPAAGAMVENIEASAPHAGWRGVDLAGQAPEPPSEDVWDPDWFTSYLDWPGIDVFNA